MIKCQIGNIVTISNANFPIVLRKGPGYSHNYVCTMSAKEFGIVLGGDIGHGMIIWVQLLISGSGEKGWIPETVLTAIVV